MKLTQLLFIFSISIILFNSCQNTDEPVITYEETNYQPNEDEVAFEQLIANIDSNDSLREGRSLAYSREDGASAEVLLFVNEANETVKIVEEYTKGNSPSISSNTFHFDKGIMISSKELFEEGEGEKAHFIERITYYNEKEEPIITKQKIAAYEEELDFETFSIVKNTSCSYKRALKALNRTGEYSTTFQGFVTEDPYLYLIVGENKKDGYYSSLVVQYMTPTIKKLQENEVGMMGTQLEVDNETLNGEQGYVYQILMGVKIL